MCQRYIDAPLLYRGRKFDLRVLVAVRSFAPAPAPDALCWRECYVRVANRAYDAGSARLGDFQTHFTSMRQRGFAEEAVSEADLAAEFTAQGHNWAAARDATRAMIRSLLAAAARTIGAFPRGRALYGIDVMFDAAARPMLLEVTFCPGVERPMGSDPLFFDKLFGCLFLVRARARVRARRCSGCVTPAGADGTRVVCAAG